MQGARENLTALIVVLLAAFVLTSAGASTALPDEPAVPVLVYHRFHPAVSGPTTVTVATFESQLKTIREAGGNIVPLRTLVEHLMNGKPPLPRHPVVITADDGHVSVYTELYPIILREKISVTLFLYPSVVSREDYALTWEQIRRMMSSGLVEVQSHSYWHPNFKVEKRRLDAQQYAAFVDDQLRRSRLVLQSELGARVDMLAWPFGIVDDELIEAARRAGYIAAFTIERRVVTRQERMMALPRFMIVESDRGRALERLLQAR